jgi:exopolysaccharide biosynthesis polyprenyl glycosylphosphotransferase
MRYEQQLIRPVDEINSAPFVPFIPWVCISMAWILLANQGARLYQDRRDRSLIHELFRIANAASNAAIFIMALSFLIRPLVFSRLLILFAFFLIVLLLGLWRMVIRVVRNSLHRRGIGTENVLLVGIGELGLYVMRTIMARPGLGYHLIGFIDDDPERGTKDIGRVPALGPTRNLATLITEQNVDLVIVTLPWRAQRRIIEIVRECHREDIAVRAIPDLFQLNMSQVHIEMLGGVPLMGIRQDIAINRTSMLFKRITDITVTLLLLPLLLPLMAITALAIRIESPGPILFHQERVGFNGRHFKMYKFRSMIVNAEAMAEKFVTRTEDDPEGKLARKDDDPRITRVGHFIRRSSIDELPQFFNVLRGEMSLVGPRPALPEEVDLYKPWHRQRLHVRPGITGLWQVSGRADIPFEEKVLLDIYYIENWSLGIDFQILAQTAPQIVFGRGAY